jgi:hypothetical protein
MAGCEKNVLNALMGGSRLYAPSAKTVATQFVQCVRKGIFTHVALGKGVITGLCQVQDSAHTAKRAEKMQRKQLNRWRGERANLVQNRHIH